LLLDEPAASFEGPDRLEILKVIERLTSVTTIIFTTDRLSDADSTGADAVLIQGGRLEPAVRTSD
jgi:ABC-type multidrug transport system ATPase subunit